MFTLYSLIFVTLRRWLSPIYGDNEAEIVASVVLMVATSLMLYRLAVVSLGFEQIESVLPLSSKGALMLMYLPFGIAHEVALLWRQRGLRVGLKALERWPWVQRIAAPLTVLYVGGCTLAFAVPLFYL